MYGGGGISSPAISTSKSVLFNRCWLVASWCCSKPNKEVFFLQIISYCSTQEVPLNGPRGLCLYSIRSTFFLGDENHLIRQKAAPIPPLPHTFNLALFHSFSTFQFFFQFTCPPSKRQKKSGNCKLSDKSQYNDTAIILFSYQQRAGQNLIIYQMMRSCFV